MGSPLAQFPQGVKLPSPSQGLVWLSTLYVGCPLFSGISHSLRGISWIFLQIKHSTTSWPQGLLLGSPKPNRKTVWALTSTGMALGTLRCSS